MADTVMTEMVVPLVQLGLAVLIGVPVIAAFHAWERRRMSKLEQAAVASMKGKTCIRGSETATCPHCNGENSYTDWLSVEGDFDQVGCPRCRKASRVDDVYPLSMS